jgi:endonuclease-3
LASASDVREIDARLREAFGTPRRRQDGPLADAVEELVSTVLSQHTTGPNSDRALGALRDRFPTWEAVADARADEIAAAIRSAGLANQKAPRIKAMLAAIRAERGAADLSFLANWPADQAMAWLCRLPGVGQTTAACLLLFGLDRPAMPVDTGIGRVAGRLGLAPPRAPAVEVAAALSPNDDPAEVYALHVNLIRLAREICRPREPLCEVCPLNDLCAYFRAARAGVRASLP